jgi:outer membrane protein insertion porin family
MMLCFTPMVWAQAFTVSDIRIEGLQRVDLGNVFRAFTIEIGEPVDEYRLAAATRELFATGYFNDIQLAREGDVLIVKVQERPAISKIEIEGNQVLKDEDLLEGLKQLGLNEGEVFQRVTLERIKLEMVRIYAAQGRYGAQVNAEVENLPENRVGILINVKEGDTASIQHINIVGNQVFTGEALKELFSLKTPGFWSFFTTDDRYSREKLGGDLERLRSYYLDRGYINFDIESTQVSISPGRQDVYITVNVNEGALFTVGDYDVTGDMVVAHEELLSLVTLEPGAIFSRQDMVRSADQLSKRLGDAGYLFANINPIPQIDEALKTVSIKFFISPGRRAYIRRVDFNGNTKTADEVLRREMRQMEAAVASTVDIEASKDRLERLRYFSSVNVETKAVPGADDQIDLEYSVEEQMSGNLSASIGFSQSSGLILAASVSQDNFLGTGKHVSFGINNSDTNTEYRFSFTDPYYTVDGVSRGFNLFFRQQNFDDDDVSDYSTDAFGGGVNFGYPIDEFQRLNFGLGYENLQVNADLTEDSELPDEIKSFINDEGDQYDQLALTGSWSDNHLNKGLLATDGYSQSISLEVAAPGSSLSYFKLRYRGQRYFPLTEVWILKLGTQLGYGDSFGDTSELPFFKNFFSGGFGSVRGFKNNTLGPKADNADKDPLGGDMLVQGSAELIFPMPFVEDQSNLRSLLFLDAGNVYDSSCLSTNLNCQSGIDLAELRLSAGIGLSWLTFVGPLSFSLAKPINEGEFDESEVFQFALGRTF